MNEHCVWRRLKVGSCVALFSAALACLASLASPPSANAAPGRLYITLGFDDGTLSEFQHRGLLNQRGLHGTYYVNSGKLGQPDYMTWQELETLADEGHEIGGHTVDHARLPDFDRETQRDQVCDDRQALLSQGFAVTNFAYPHGVWNADSLSVMAECGYDTARTTGGLSIPHEPCDPCTEDLSPPTPHLVRAWQAMSDNTLADYQQLITQSIDAGGGWLPLVFHDLCEGAECATADEYAVDTGLFAALLTWIGQDNRLRVRTTAKVLAIGRDTTAPQVGLTSPAGHVEFTAGQVFAVSASASDDVEVDRVEFLVDGQLAHSDSQAPYDFAWTTPSTAGTHLLRARSFDEAGHSTMSPTRTVKLEEPVTPPPPVFTGPVLTPGPTPSLRPRSHIASVKPKKKGRWRVTIVLKRSAAARRVHLLFNGRVVRSRTQPSARLGFDFYPPAGRHTIVVETIDAHGVSHRSPKQRLVVKGSARRR